MTVDATKARSIFTAAVENHAPDQWGQFLDAACGCDTAMRGRVELLLKAHQGDDSFLDRGEDDDRGPIDGLVATVVPPAEKPGALIGPYKLLEQIGEGGMGLVYMAQQTEPVKRKVALKVIKPGMDSKQVIARFEAERQALAMMDHPNIARILDAGTTGGQKDEGGRMKDESGYASFSPHPSSFRSAGRPFFVMDLVRGVPITEYVSKQRLHTPERLKLFLDVCHAVQHAHQKGIIHRDLKPSNVLITLHDGTPVVKVIDFGVAKALNQELTEKTLFTQFSQMVGTPLYMSPEQAELSGLDIDTRSDVYSLGVLLYELLTGTTPFDKERLKNAGFDEMRRIIREEEPETVSARIARTRRIGVPPVQNSNCTPCAAPPSSPVPSPSPQPSRRSELDWIAMKALEKDRSRRYESASALAADIQRYLSDEPVLACPPTAMYRFQKFARKHKPALVTAAAIVVCLILGTTVSAWQAVRATTAEAQANANEQKAVVNEQKANTQRDEAQRQSDEVKTLNEKLNHTLYIAHMNMARHAWDASAIDQMEELLEEHRPKAGEADLRGFEWYYLHRLCHSDLLTLKGHTGGVLDVAFSPDGKRLASASDDKTIRIWDAQTGKEIRAIRGHTGEVSDVAFSPDGKWLASASGDKTARVWDAETGQELVSFKGHTEGVLGVDFSPDGKRVATGSGDKTLKVWDAQTAQEYLSLNHRDGVGAVAYSPDGKQLAGGYQREGECTVKVWDAQTGEELFVARGSTTSNPDSVAFSPDSKRVTAGGSVWDEYNASPLFVVKDGAFGLTFSPDGKYLAGGGWPLRLVTIFDAQTGKRLASFKGHSDWFRRVAFSPDSQRLASASYDGTVKIWDVTVIRQEGRTLGQYAFRDVAYSPDGKRVAGVCDDATIKVFDVLSGNLSLTFEGHGRLYHVACSPDGKRLASSAAGDGVKLWDAETGRELLAISGNADGRAVAFSPDGTRFAGFANGVLKIWDARTGREVLSIKDADHGVAFSPDGKRLASGSGGNVKIWDAQTGQELQSLKAHSSGVSCVAFSPNGKRLAAGAWQGKSKVWDTQTGQELLSLTGHTQKVWSVIFSPDGKRLASSSGDNTVKVWDAQTGKETLTLKDSGYGVAFSPDGQRLIGGGDNGLKIWDATPLPEQP